MIKFIFSGLIICLLCGCTGLHKDEVLFEDFYAIPGECWERDHPLVFETTLSDSGAVRLGILLRHTATYPLSNLAYTLNISRNGHQLFRDTASLFVADEEGNRKGQGKIMKTLSEIPTSVFHPDTTGTYRISIRHRMKTAALPGVKDVGIRITKQ